MVVNMTVDNPTSAKAALSRLDYKVYIDDEYIADGSTVEPFTVEAMQKGNMPLKVKVNVIELLNGKSATASIGVIKNLLGIGSTPSKITLQLKPFFMMGNSQVGMPGYYPMSFKIGDKQ